MARETRITQTKIHYPESPIWDTCITAIEVFYPGERAEDPLIHALIEYSELTRRWECQTCLIIPGIDECDPHYSTAEVKLMVTNPPVGEVLPNDLRLASRRTRSENSEKVQRAAVYSVRVLYNGKHIFLDRIESNWQSWIAKNDKVTLSTDNVLGILSSAVRSPQ
jgi:hypothetical protein